MVSRGLLISVLFLFFIDTALAHSGRTNSSGCHNNRKTGGYHCHNGGGYRGGKSYKSKSSSTYKKPTYNVRKKPRKIPASPRSVVKKLPYSAAPSKITSAPNSYVSSYTPRDIGSLTVEAIQRSLAYLGYNPGPVDGIYGEKTKSAIESFQKDNELRVDGKASYALLLFIRSRL